MTRYKLADFGRERLGDADRHRHDRCILRACRSVDCDEVSGVLDHTIAKDRVPEIGPRAVRSASVGSAQSGSRQRKAEQQDT